MSKPSQQLTEKGIANLVEAFEEYGSEKNTYVNKTADGYDTWEIGYFQTDSQGLAIKPLLGVRVNGGTWVDARILRQLYDNYE